MPKPKKPFPGMGKFVVITRYPGEDVWSAYAGANTMEGARKRMRELSHYASENITIAENVPGADLPAGAKIYGYNYR